MSIPTFCLVYSNGICESIPLLYTNFSSINHPTAEVGTHVGRATPPEAGARQAPTTNLPTVSDPSSLRVADADREQLAQELREHMLAGRLTSDEFEQRLERVYAATTRGELDALKVDLPLSPMALGAALAERKTKLRRRLVQEAGGAVGLWILLTSVWLAGGAGEFWPGWVILVTILPLVRNAWRLLGPAPDLESVEAHLNARRSRQLARERHRGHRRELPR